MKHLIWLTLILVACSGYDDSDDGDYGSDYDQDSAGTTYVPANRGTTPGSGGSSNRGNGGTGGGGGSGGSTGGTGGTGGNGGSGGSTGGTGGATPVGTGGSGSTPNPPAPSPVPTTTSQPSTPTPPAIQCHRAESCVTATYSYPTTGLCGGFMAVTVTNNCTESVYVNVEATGCDGTPGGTSGGLDRVRSGEKWSCSLGNYYPKDCDAVHFRAAAEDDDARCYLFD